MGVIYKITTPTNKRYIGQTKHVRKRIAAYKSKAADYTGTILILKSIHKYGWDAHIFEVIEEDVPDDLLDEREKYWIKHFKTFIYQYPKDGGLNLTTGGNGEGTFWPKEDHRRKVASDSVKGEKNPFYGKKHTEESKRIVGDKNRKKMIEKGQTVPEWGAEKGRNIVRKPVLAYDLKGNFLREYKSVTETAICLGIDVSCVAKVCKRKHTKAKGFVFRYKDEGVVKSVDTSDLKKNKGIKRPVLLLSPFGTIIKEYPSSIEASEDTKVNYGTIKWIARVGNMRPLSSGHIFIYKDTYETFKSN